MSLALELKMNDGRMTNHVHVVMTGLLLSFPQPDVQVLVSKQYPPRPQSVAAITVVGQNPHKPTFRRLSATVENNTVQAKTEIVNPRPKSSGD